MSKCPDCLDSGVQRGIRPGEKDKVCTCVVVLHDDVTLPPRANPAEVLALLGLPKEFVTKVQAEETLKEAQSNAPKTGAAFLEVEMNAFTPDYLRQAHGMPVSDSMAAFEIECAVGGTFNVTIQGIGEHARRYVGVTLPDIRTGILMMAYNAGANKLHHHFEEMVTARKVRTTEENQDHVARLGIVNTDIVTLTMLMMKDFRAGKSEADIEQAWMKRITSLLASKIIDKLIVQKDVNNPIAAAVECMHGGLWDFNHSVEINISPLHDPHAATIRKHTITFTEEVKGQDRAWRMKPDPCKPVFGETKCGLSWVPETNLGTPPSPYKGTALKAMGLGDYVPSPFGRKGVVFPEGSQEFFIPRSGKMPGTPMDLPRKDRQPCNKALWAKADSPPVTVECEIDYSNVERSLLKSYREKIINMGRIGGKTAMLRAMKDFGLISTTQAFNAARSTDCTESALSKMLEDLNNGRRSGGVQETPGCSGGDIPGSPPTG